MAPFVEINLHVNSRNHTTKYIKTLIVKVLKVYLVPNCTRDSPCIQSTNAELFHNCMACWSQFELTNVKFSATGGTWRDMNHKRVIK
jgi:hypothetical protein